MGYPTAYRSNSHQPKGSQQGGGFRPANDNRPPYRHGTPANDNRPSLRRNTAGRYALKSAGRSMLLRALPYAGAALTLYELYELWQKWEQDNPQGHYFLTPSGWEVRRDCPVGMSTTSTSHFFCGTVAQYNINFSGLPNKGIGVYRDGSYWRYKSLAWAGWWIPIPDAPHEQWKPQKELRKFAGLGVKPRPSPLPGYKPYPVQYPQPEPMWIPWIYPADAPISAPQVNPNIKPSWKEVPSVRPLRNPIRWPKTKSRPSPDTGYTTMPELDPALNPRLRGDRAPSRENKPEVSIRRNRPPGKREKERKVVGFSNAMIGFFNELSELGDLSDAFHDALPCKLRLHKRSTTPAQRAAQLYRHYDEVNFGQAIKNAIADQIEDYIYGTLGKAQKATNQRIGQAYGKQASALRIIHRHLDELEPGAWDPFGDIYDTVSETLDKLANTVLGIRKQNTC